MPWPRFRNPIQKLIVPTADLGLGELDFSGLHFPEDVPLVIALQAVQTPAGARIAQFANNGSSSTSQTAKRIVRATTTEGAGNTGIIDFTGFGGCTLVVEVLALTGAPTNITYRPAFTPDGGTTWYEGVNLVATTTGVVLVSMGLNSQVPTSGNNILASGGIAMQFVDGFRLDWVFTGGAGPTVTHRITGFFR